MLPASDGARDRLRNSDRDATCSLSRSISPCARLYLAYNSLLSGFSLVMMTGSGVNSGGGVMGGAVTGPGSTCRCTGTGRGAGAGTESWGSGIGSAVVSAEMGSEVEGLVSTTGGAGGDSGG